MTKPHEQNPLADNSIDPSHQFYSLGFLCQMLQQLPHQVQAIAEAAKVEVAMTIDAVPYYRGTDIQAMAKFVADFRDSVATN